MVCGKLFPRGEIDLQRHSTAVTLRHSVSKKLNSNHSFGPCERCGLYFNRSEHYLSHSRQTTCNPNYIWPDFSDRTSIANLKAVPKDTQLASNSTGNSFDFKPSDSYANVEAFVVSQEIVPILHKKIIPEGTSISIIIHSVIKTNTSLLNRTQSILFNSIFIGGQRKGFRTWRSRKRYSRNN